MSRLRICIDARIPSGGELGGVEQFVIGLSSGLSRLRDGDEEYLFLANESSNDWLRPYLNGEGQFLYGPAATRQPAWTQALNKSAFLRSTARTLFNSFQHNRLESKVLPVPHSDGLIERVGCHLIHFPTQSGFLTSVPSIYQPWDLQHLHFPQFFSPPVIRRREADYRAFCKQAEMVAVATTWQKQELITRYQLPEGKVKVVEPAAVSDVYPIPSAEDLAAAKRKFNLPPGFIFYPAQTWPHKNHLKLLEALAHLRDHEGLIVPLVSSGRLNNFFPEIERRVRNLNLANQVSFLGYVSSPDLQSLYKLCRGMIFPSLFEGFGLPLVEALQMGVPSACSNVTSLTALVGDAALIFDPNQREDIAAAIQRLWTDSELRQNLSARGPERVSAFTWERTARIFRAHYRRLAGRRLSTADESLISEPPLV